MSTETETLELGAHGSPMPSIESLPPEAKLIYAEEDALSDARYAKYQAKTKRKDDIRAERTELEKSARAEKNPKREKELLAQIAAKTNELRAIDDNPDNSIPVSLHQQCTTFLRKAGYQRFEMFGIKHHVAEATHEAAQLVKGKNPANAIEAMREYLKDCESKMADVEGAPLPKSDHKRALMDAFGGSFDSEVESAFMKASTPEIFVQGDREILRMPICTFPTITLTGSNGLQKIDDAFGLVCWLFPDAIEAKVNAFIAQHDYSGAIPLKDRAPMLAAIAEKQLFAQRVAEHFFREGRKSGVPVQRLSAEVSPLAVLDIVPRMKTRR